MPVLMIFLLLYFVWEMQPWMQPLQIIKLKNIHQIIVNCALLCFDYVNIL